MWGAELPRTTDVDIVPSGDRHDRQPGEGGRVERGDHTAPFAKDA